MNYNLQLAQLAPTYNIDTEGLSLLLTDIQRLLEDLDILLVGLPDIMEGGLNWNNMPETMTSLQKFIIDNGPDKVFEE